MPDGELVTARYVWVVYVCKFCMKSTGILQLLPNHLIYDLFINIFFCGATPKIVPRPYRCFFHVTRN
jgi:hypothetical protein